MSSGESPSSPQSPFSPNTPSFFTPSFLGALQEDEESNFGAHQTFPTMDRHTGHFETPSVEQNTIMTSIVSHTTDKPPILFTHHSPPLSDQGSYSSSSASPRQNVTSSFDNMFNDENPYNSMLALNSSISETQMRPLIQKYLGAEDASALGEKTVVILTSKVAQKSYGTEKRFLCPPPTAILVGTSWWTGKPNDTTDMLRIPVNETEQSNGTLAPPKLSVLMSGETQAQPGQIEWYTVSGATVGQTGHVKSIQQQQQEHPSRFRSSESRNNNNIDWYHNQDMEFLTAGKSVSKHLFINDADEKRKRVECLIKLQLANGIHFGHFASKGIKVISKPSKKRQSVKNMELCIHHGTTVSLFNRIRSQTVSTKYLGVSTGNGSPFTFPGQQQQRPTSSSTTTKGDGTCFVARTTCWDPFVIWIVDTARNPGEGRESDIPEDYIGRHAHIRNVHYPPPPAIALRNKTNQLVPIHYNQHIVLQCLTTGLVSPVMIIRKVDKASTVVGGARVGNDDNGGGGEYGDEMLGDPVSQLHKVALQIVQDPTYYIKPEYSNHPPIQQISMPKSSHPITYLACLNDMVGMHRTSEVRKPIAEGNDHLFDITSQEGGKVVRKRRVSTDTTVKNIGKLNDLQQQQLGQDRRRRVNSSDTNSEEFDVPGYFNGNAATTGNTRRKSSSIGSRRGSVAGTPTGLGSYWSEDVSDAAVWTIVGTDCATYTFWDTGATTLKANEDALFPSVHYIGKKEDMMLLHGENFSRDLQIWFGDVKAARTEYKGRELIMCKLPLYGNNESMPLLLVRGDGTICKTNKMYPFI
ncbi:hypothetical protein K501DRAFT_327139 [Backusella circina FSU 941]|nr:hypothetical protein K501DRAFT_327139 [Backusella circina FSU 941]